MTRYLITSIEEPYIIEAQLRVQLLIIFAQENFRSIKETLLTNTITGTAN